MNGENNFLGTGWAFPPTFNITHKGVKMISDKEDIENSLQVLLSTRRGERIMQPEFGCNLDVLLFEPITLGLSTSIRDTVIKAITFFEPRVIPNNVKLEPYAEEGIIYLHVDYTIVSTNTRYNLVYPFFLNEGKVTG